MPGTRPTPGLIKAVPVGGADRVRREPQRDDHAPCRTVRYACPKGHEFEVPLADDAEIPRRWECRSHSTDSEITDGSGHEEKEAKRPRTHWDMVLERRSMSELDETLQERLALLRARRAG